jgi:hypothetical protein
MCFHNNIPFYSRSSRNRKGMNVGLILTYTYCTVLIFVFAMSLVQMVQNFGSTLEHS